MLNLLADFVVRINSGLRRRSKCVYVPYSSLTLRVSRILFSYNCIVSFNVVTGSTPSTFLIKIVPLYVNNASILRELTLMSRPGLRLYWSAHELSEHFFRNNYQGFYIVSTSQGLCSSNDLILSNILKKPISGEVLLKLSF